jgi:hypothetical protein
MRPGTKRLGDFLECWREGQLPRSRILAGPHEMALSKRLRATKRAACEMRAGSALGVLSPVLSPSSDAAWRRHSPADGSLFPAHA